MLVACIALGIVFLIHCLWLLKFVWRSQTAYLAMVLLVFFIANGIGFIVPVDFTNETYFYSLDQGWLFKSGMAYIPLMIGGGVAVKYLAKKTLHPARHALHLRPWMALTLIGASYLSVVVVSRYLVLQGWEKILAWRNIVDFLSSYDVRYSFEAVYSQGAWSSMICAFCIIPVSCGVLLFYWRQVPIQVRLGVVAIPVVISLLRGAASLQRAGIILQMMVIGTLLALPLVQVTQRNLLLTRRLALRVAIVGGVLFVVVGAVVYSRSDETLSPIANMLRRSVVTPSHTAALYFGYFPEVLPFRGLVGALGMPVGDWDTFRSEEISIKLIGFLANGWAHNANANFLATAYTGLGWWTVVLMVGIFIGLTMYWSGAYAKADPFFPYLAFIASIYTIYSVIQADFGAGLSTGYVFNQFFLVAIAKWGFVSQPFDVISNAAAMVRDEGRHFVAFGAQTDPEAGA